VVTADRSALNVMEQKAWSLSRSQERNKDRPALPIVLIQAQRPPNLTNSATVHKVFHFVVSESVGYTLSQDCDNVSITVEENHG